MERTVKELDGAELDLLLIEDSVPDAELAVRLLTAAGYKCRHRRVESEKEMRQALKDRLPDLILSDFRMPGFDGMSALVIARAEAPGVPFIFLSGTIGEERAIEASKERGDRLRPQEQPDAPRASREARAGGCGAPSHERISRTAGGSFDRRSADALRDQRGGRCVFRTATSC